MERGFNSRALTLRQPRPHRYSSSPLVLALVPGDHAVAFAGRFVICIVRQLSELDRLIRIPKSSPSATEW